MKTVPPPRSEPRTSLSLKHHGDELGLYTEQEERYFDHVVLQGTDNLQPHSRKLWSRCWVWSESFAWFPILFLIQAGEGNQGIDWPWSVRVLPPKSTSFNPPSCPCCSCLWRTDNSRSVDICGLWSLLLICSEPVTKLLNRSLSLVQSC